MSAAPPKTLLPFTQRASVAPADRDALIEAESVWNERGYWSVPYLEEGTYFLLQ